MPLDVGSSSELQLIENNNINDSKMINNLNDKRLVIKIVMFVSFRFVHKNLSPR